MKEKRYILFTSCLSLLWGTTEGKCAMKKLIPVTNSEADSWSFKKGIEIL